VYFNIVRSIKNVLGTLAAYDDIDDGSDANSILEVDADDGSSIINSSPGKRKGKASAFTNLLSTPTASTSAIPITPTSSSLQLVAPSSQSPKHTSTHQIANLRLRLSPLLAVEEQLATRLSGGVTVSGSGKGEVFVRSGWQTRTIQAGGLFKGRRPKRGIYRSSHENNTTTTGRVGTSDGLLPEEDPLLDDVANMLEASKEDIKALWDHPTVVALIASRKLKLDEWSEL
jgi:hypothetical protein